MGPVLKANSRCLRPRMHPSKQPATTSKFSRTGKTGMARTFSTRNTPNSRCIRCPSAETRATKRRTCLTRSQTCAVRPSESRAAEPESQLGHTARRASILKRPTIGLIKTSVSTSPRRPYFRRKRLMRWRLKPPRATSQQQTRMS